MDLVEPPAQRGNEPVCLVCQAPASRDDNVHAPCSFGCRGHHFLKRQIVGRVNPRIAVVLSDDIPDIRHARSLANRSDVLQGTYDVIHDIRPWLRLQRFDAPVRAIGRHRVQERGTCRAAVSCVDFLDGGMNGPLFLRLISGR